jgi:hypothetical protein
LAEKNEAGQVVYGPLVVPLVTALLGFIVGYFSRR